MEYSLHFYYYKNIGCCIIENGTTTNFFIQCTKKPFSNVLLVKAPVLDYFLNLCFFGFDFHISDTV